MALAPGTRLGAYEVLSLLGSGGMGEVYLARDTKLRREVAIKVLPEGFAADSDRIARFQREAELLAALNHPNIAAVYGVEEMQRASAIVLELIEGETLRDRIARGALPLDEAIPIARQIVDALETAHDRGIVHRDLKPANIKITPEGKVKVLDFGLAKMAEREGSKIGSSMSPTLNAHGTFAGVILGTAAYMSPEQARGKPVDRRTDIWAFGCVLSEMLTGKQPFEGETVSDAIATILKGDIDWTALPADTPPHVRSLLRRCLQKDPQKRIPHIGVVRLELDEGPTEAAPAPSVVVQRIVPRRPLWKRALPIVGVATIVGALGMAVGWSFKRPLAPPITRFPIVLAESQAFTGAGRQVVAISPDGTHIAYGANQRLFLRSLSDLEARAIAGTETTTGTTASPVFSPDGRSIAFVGGDRMLKRIALSGGTAITVCAVEGYPYGVSWDTTGILFGMSSKGILRVSSNGGTPDVVVPAKAGEQLHTPQMLPDGQTVLFTVGPASGGAWDTARIVAQSLMSGERKTLIEGGTGGRYLPTGHLVYALRGVLFAVPFDAARLEVAGGPVPLVEGVRTDSGTAHYSFSATGSLVYVPGPLTGAANQDLALIDRKGDAQALKLPIGRYDTPRVSPDGRHVAFGVDEGNEQMVWVYDLAGTASVRRLTFGGKNRFPIWSADSQRVAFQSDRENDSAVFWQRADGTGTAERLTKPEQGTVHVPESWSPDGRYVLVGVTKGSNFSLWTLLLQDKTMAPFEGVQSTAPINATFSPDGRWVAYQSTETGMSQIYVQPFPPTGAKYQISKTNGNSIYPLWSRDGKELFSIPAPRQFVAVSVTTKPSFAFSNPTTMARSVFIDGGPPTVRNYDAARDGRIMAVIPAAQVQSEAARAPQIQVVLNWFEDVKQRVPLK
jgi:Tol biopolymer transport system component